MIATTRLFISKRIHTEMEQLIPMLQAGIDIDDGWGKGCDMDRRVHMLQAFALYGEETFRALYAWVVHTTLSPSIQSQTVYIASFG
jgi:hypothetical protein